MSKKFIALSLIYWVFACGQGHPIPLADPASTSRPIIGGTPDSGHPAVGALVSNNAMCTGTLISPHVVLTAAHCAEGGKPNYFIIGSSIYSGQSIPVKAFIQHPNYQEKYENGAYVTWHDIAVAILSSPAPVTPMPYRTTPMEGTEGQEVTFVGFGATKGGYYPSGEGYKYKVTVTVGAVWSQGFWNFVQGGSVKNTCVGDSGGPGLMMMNGQETIVGVVSLGDPYCEQNGYNTRTDKNADFIAQMIAQYDPGWLNPQCGNGICESGESESSCPQDCGPVCGNGKCESGEDSKTCPADCGGSIWAPCGQNYSCPSGQICVDPGDGTAHCTVTCNDPYGGSGCPTGFVCAPLQGGGGACIPASTGPVCGNGKCESGEDSKTCPADCGGSIWAPCGQNYSCPSGQICVDPGDGTAHCTVTCNDPYGGSGCPTGFVCAPLQGGGGACIPASTGPVCGNGKCESGETPTSCPQDCGPVCGNGKCEPGEDSNTCPKDCAVCGNGKCESGETPTSCPQDCGPVCGNGKCEPGEDSNTCPKDCAVCGNGQCETGEDASSCPSDCPPPAVCGNGICEDGEGPLSCPKDCFTPPPPVCGNGSCEPTETPETCPADCPLPSPQCGNGSCEEGEDCSQCPRDCGPCPSNPSQDASQGPDPGQEDTSEPPPQKGGGGCRAYGPPPFPSWMLSLFSPLALLIFRSRKMHVRR